MRSEQHVAGDAGVRHQRPRRSARTRPRPCRTPSSTALGRRDVAGEARELVRWSTSCGETATRSPCAAKRRAHANPMPRVPPVTTTVRRASLMSVRSQRTIARRATSCRRRSRRTARGRRATAPCVERVDERERDRRRRRVAGVVEHDRRPLDGHAELGVGRLDDADVGLVRHHERDVVGGDAGVRASCVAAESTMIRTARRKTSLPSIWMKPPMSRRRMRRRTRRIRDPSRAVDSRRDRRPLDTTTRRNRRRTGRRCCGRPSR